MSNDCDEQIGKACCNTKWGKWYQTLEDVIIVVDVEKGTRGKEVSVKIEPQRISCYVRGEEVFCGRLKHLILVDDSTWSIEDRVIIRILLVKSGSRVFWDSLFEDGSYTVDPWTRSQMQKNITRERYEKENPGFDFSNAEISGYNEEGQILDLRQEY